MLKFWPLIVLAVCLIAAAPIQNGQQSQPPPSRTSQQNSAQEQRGTETVPLVVKILPSEKAQDEIAKENAERDAKAVVDGQIIGLTRDLARYTKLLFIATAILALITFGLVAVGYLQARDAKKSIAAAEASAAAAMATVITMRDAERARIGVDYWIISNFGVGLKPIAVCKFINSGRSPAEITQVLLEWHIGQDVALTPGYITAIQGAHSTIRGNGGDTTQPVRFTEELTQSEFDDVVARNWCIFVWGKIVYSDGFKSNSETGFGVKAIYQSPAGAVPQWAFEYIGKPGYNYFT